MKKPLSRRSRRSRKGFTLVEMLTVVLIISLLMDIALPLYLNALDDAKKKTCRSNMQTISNAVEAARVKQGYLNYGTLITNGVTVASLSDLTAVPKCPAGGTYTLTNGNSGSSSTFQVNCSLSAHGKFQPGVDSN